MSLELGLDAGDVEPVIATLQLPVHRVQTGGAVGLSFDATELANSQWGASDSNLTLTLQQLDRPVLRFGGNGVDRRMWWTSSGEPAPAWAEATVTPDSLEAVARTAESVDASVTITLDLGHDDPERAADMAAAAQSAFGDRLLAVSIGNEPNGYHHENQPQLAVRDASWGPQAYQVSLREYSSAIDDAAPGVKVSGPGAYDATWWRAFAESDIRDPAALTMHWYPLWDCSGPATSIANPTVEDLSSPALRSRARKIIGMGRDIADEHGLPLWLEETGPTSCPGSNATSRTHAQALWTVDYALTAMEEGVSRIAFHSTLQSCRGGAPMSPICSRGTLEEPGSTVQGRTSYLALIQLGQIAQGEVLESTLDGDGSIAVHGVLGDDGSLTLVVVDFRDPSTETNDQVVQIGAPSGLGASASKEWVLSTGSLLSSGSLDSTTSTLTAPGPITGTFAGARLGPGAPLTVPSSPGESLLLRLEPATAVSNGG